jgi:hypothetical protein
MTEHLTSQPALRPARPEDFDYCARLYFEGMNNIIKAPNLNQANASNRINGDVDWTRPPRLHLSAKWTHPSWRGYQR